MFCRYLFVALLKRITEVYLEKQLPTNKIDALLEEVPVEVDKLYEILLFNIDRKYLPILASVFKIVTSSLRPLTQTELYAMLLIAGHNFSDYTSFCSLISSCQGLLKLTSFHPAPVFSGSIGGTNISSLNDTKHEHVDIVHLSFKQFLFNKKLQNVEWLPLNTCECNEFLADLCIKHLFSPHNKAHQTSELSQDMQSILDAYASKFWPDHVSAVEELSNSSSRITKAAVDLLRDVDARKATLLKYNPDWPNEAAGSSSLRQRLTDGSALYYAARMGLSGVVAQLIANGEDMMDIGGRYSTPLHAAALCGDKVTLEVLLSACNTAEAVAEPTPQDFSNLFDIITSPLRLASYADLNDSDKETISHVIGADEERGRCGSVIQLASFGGDAATVGLCVEHDMKVDLGSLHAAAYAGNLEIFKFLWDKWSDDGELRFGCDERGRTALHKAAISNKAGMMNHLLELNFNAEALDDQQSTPLHLAGERQSFECFDLLVSRQEWRRNDAQFIVDITGSIDKLVKDQTEVDLSKYEKDNRYPTMAGAQGSLTVLKRKTDMSKSVSVRSMPKTVSAAVAYCGISASKNPISWSKSATALEDMTMTPNTR